MRDQFLWTVFVFRGSNERLVHTFEATGNRAAIIRYAKWLQEGDRYEAVPKPIECLLNKEFHYDYQAFEAMKISRLIKDSVAKERRVQRTFTQDHTWSHAAHP